MLEKLKVMADVEIICMDKEEVKKEVDRLLDEKMEVTVSAIPNPFSSFDGRFIVLGTRRKLIIRR